MLSNEGHESVAGHQKVTMKLTLQHKIQSFCYLNLREMYLFFSCDEKTVPYQLKVVNNSSFSSKKKILPNVLKFFQGFPDFSLSHE